LIITMFAGCSAQGSAPALISTNDEIISSAYPIDTVVDLHTEKQAAFLSSSTLSTKGYANGKKNNSAPKPVEFVWDCNNAADGTQYVLSISENADMSDAVTYTTTSESLEVYNLKIATDYYWTVSGDGNTSGIFTFTTSDIPPRNIHVDGITNVRDLGGRMTENGTRTKQGLIYRCGRLNESSAETPNIEITDDGKRTMLNELGIKSEIDVRKVYDGETGAITSSPLGDTVTYFSCPMEWEGNTFVDNHDELLRVFEILSKQENYPIIFHCNIGTDRTGMIAYLVNALLGVPEEELYKDYVFSNFGNIGGTRSIDQLKESGYYKAVSEAQGNSLSEKTYNCLADFGVPSEQLDAIISILS
ncbi:MAG: tyrosine-protein phosphatase, partial [Eubacterium sp.]|nr:tyrosine-protein phosphatase [Eubacterium sp.]